MKRQDISFSEFKGGKFFASYDFSKTFPQMTALLERSTKVDFKINSILSFRQYIWTLSDGSTAGWLCRTDHCVPVGRNIIDEHSLLATELGGIIEVWIDNSRKIDIETFIDNNNFTFCLADTTKGLGGWEEKYLKSCKDDGVDALDPADFVTFALDTNGNTTFYNYKTKEVFIFLQDGYSPFDSTLVEGQPEYTVHQLKNAGTFDKYVELLAGQWLDIINK